MDTRPTEINGWGNLLQKIVSEPNRGKEEKEHRNFQTLLLYGMVVILSFPPLWLNWDITNSLNCIYLVSSGYTAKQQSSRQYGIGTKTDI